MGYVVVYETGKKKRRNRGALAAVLAVCGLLVGILGYRGQLHRLRLDDGSRAAAAAFAEEVRQSPGTALQTFCRTVLGER